MRKLKIKLYPILENIFMLLEQVAGAAREHFAICTDCGANRYTGKPCVKFGTVRQFIAEE